jgi:hypothetical protein
LLSTLSVRVQQRLRIFGINLKRHTVISDVLLLTLWPGEPALPQRPLVNELDRFFHWALVLFQCVVVRVVYAHKQIAVLGEQGIGIGGIHLKGLADWDGVVLAS